MSNELFIGRDAFQFIPLPYKLQEQLYQTWFDRYLAFQESEFPAMISIQGEPGTVGEETMIGNQKLLETLGVESLRFNLNQLLLSIIRDTSIGLDEEISPKPKINRIRDDEPLKATLEIQTPDGIVTLKLNICAYSFNGKKIGQYIEVFEITKVEDKQMDSARRISHELLTELTHQSKSVAYYISLDELDLDNLQHVQLYIDPRLQSTNDLPIQNLNEFFGSLVIPEDLERTVDGIKRAIQNFLETDQTLPIESVHPIRFRDSKGVERDLMHRIFIRKENGAIILTGYGLDLTDQFNQGNFHASLLDIIHELTTLSNYGQQLDLIVGRIKNIMPGVGTISVARPRGEGNFTFDIRHKFEDSLISNTDDIDNNILEASLKILTRVYNSKGPVIIADYLEDEATAMLVEHHNVRSYVGVPIIINGKVVGVINLSSHIPNAFTLDDIDRLQVLSRFLAIAIDREMTFEILQLEIQKATHELGMVLKAKETLLENQDKLLNAQQEAAAITEIIASKIGHDPKVPLAVIKTSTYLINHYLNDASINPDIREKILLKTVIIDEHVDKIVELMADGLHDLRQTTSFADKMANLNVRSTVYQIVKTLNEGKAQTQPNNNEVRLNLNMGNVTGELELFTNAKGFISILENLISNSIKYCNEDDEGIVNIKFNLNDEKQIIEIEIEDNGRGIPLEFREKLFKETARADNVGKVDGTGVGLRIVGFYVNNIGGSIEFNESSIKGKTVGSLFKIKIPVIKKEQQRGFIALDTKETTEA